MSRFVDRGAITAAYVGIGMAVTIVVSFLLIIPIEWVIWLLALPSGPAHRLLRQPALGPPGGAVGRGSSSTACSRALVTGLTAAVLLLAIKGLFFYADDGFRDPGLGGPVTCSTGADCVYQRYLDAGRGRDLAAAGVTDSGSFTTFYWSEQFGSAGTILLLTVIGGLGGAGLYGVFRPKPVRRRGAEPAAA